MSSVSPLPIIWAVQQKNCDARNRLVMRSRCLSRPIPSANRINKQYSNCITVPLPNASSDTRILIRAALFGLKHIYRKGYAYKKAGVILTAIDPLTLYQDSLLTQYGADEKSARLMGVMDQLNQRYGRNIVSVFSVGSLKSWSMRREIMSPCYTTKWSDLPIAHASWLYQVLQLIVSSWMVMLDYSREATCHIYEILDSTKLRIPQITAVLFSRL